MHPFRSKIFLLLLLCACSRGQRESSQVLATINSEKITVKEFEKALQIEQWKYGGEVGLTLKARPEVKAKVLEELLRDHLLLQEAKMRHLNVERMEVEKSVEGFRNQYPTQEDFEKFLKLSGSTLDELKDRRGQELLIQKLVDQVTEQEVRVTKEEIQKYYEKHVEEYNHPDQVHARQIVTDSKEKAQSLRDMIVNGSPFEEVAKKYSLSPDRNLGGDLGWFGRGMMPKEFDQICFSLETGKLSEVVATPYGFHVFEVMEKRGAGQIPLSEVQGKIQNLIKEMRKKEVFAAWYKDLQAKAKMEIQRQLLEKIP